MLNKIKTYLQNWNFMRGLRLVLGIIVIIQALIAWDIMLGIMGVFLIIMPLLNLGCCSAGACYTNNNQIKNNTPIEFEEVVIKK